MAKNTEQHNILPIMWDYSNALYSFGTPSTVHVNTGLSLYFQRYLLQKMISIFKWKIPENWDKNYFLYVLYGSGYCAVINTDKFGVIPQNCGLKGFNVFYQPREITIANPLLRYHGSELVIGRDCEVIRLMPDWRSPLDIVSYYGDMLALAAQTAGMNLVNSKLSYVFGAENKSMSESFKFMYDRIQSGEPAVVVKSDLFNEDGKAKWATFEQGVGQNFITDKVLDVMTKINMQFDTDVGIPNSNVFKRERVNTYETNANNFETQSKAQLWLESLQDGCKRVNKMFGVDVRVDWQPALKNIIEGGAEDVYNGAASAGQSV